MQRKTVEVVRIVQTANFFLANDNPLITEDMRQGVASMCETVLTMADAYAGFRYLGGWQGVESYKRAYYVKGIGNV